MAAPSNVKRANLQCTKGARVTTSTVFPQWTSHITTTRRWRATCASCTNSTRPSPGSGVLASRLRAGSCMCLRWPRIPENIRLVCVITYIVWYDFVKDWLELQLGLYLICIFYDMKQKRGYSVASFYAMHIFCEPYKFRKSSYTFLTIFVLPTANN